MTQLAGGRYRKIPGARSQNSDGLFYDNTNGDIVIALGGAIVGRIGTSGITADLEVTSEARGDILRRGASAWERHSAKTASQLVGGDGTDVKSMPVTGDVGLAHSGGNLVATVANLTQTGQAAGDLIYRDAAATFARLAKGTLGQYLQMNTGATAPEWDSIKTKWPFRVAAASGKDTDAKNGGIAGCNLAADLTATEAAATTCQNFDNSAGAFAAIETGSAGDFVQWQIFPNNTTNADICYFGHSIPFCELWFDLTATVATYTGDALAWEYWNGSTWGALTVNDYTDATAQDGKRSFGRDGAVSFMPPANWAPSSVNSISKYWIRCKVTDATKLDAARGLLNSKRHYIVTPTDGFVVPHACILTDVSIRDEAATVHAANPIVFEVVNFTTGAHSGALTFAVSKRNDNFTSLTLACAAGDVLGVLISSEDGTNEAGPFTLELGVTLV